MKTSAARRRTVVAIAALALVALLAPAAAAKPVGLIREIPIHGNIGGIAAGPEGNLWFTQNAAPFGRGPLAVGRITPQGEVTKFGSGILGKAEPSQIVAGADGNLWFTVDRGLTATGGGGVGRVTPDGQITLFPEPPGQHGSPFEIVAGADGNVWFNHAALFSPTGQTIGRITPAGEITEFGAGLSPTASVSNLVAGPDGNVWFGDESNNPAVGRITPSGEITEFGGLPPHEFTIFKGPAPGPEGNLWFSANEPEPLVERVSPAGVVERFGAGLDPRTAYVGPFVAGADGNVWFRNWKDAPRHGPETEAGLTSIGRITPSGKITEFDDCLRPMPGYAGPDFLTRGPDGNVWFTTWPSGESARPAPSSTPSIGRITPRGKITEFRLGLHQESQLEELVFAGGHVWALDRETDSIAMLALSRAPANTFIVLARHVLRHAAGARITVAVPGPGKLRTSGLGLRTTVTAARRCGAASVPVLAKGYLRRTLLQRGAPRVRLKVTFTPPGGSPFSQKTEVKLRPSPR